MILQDTKEKFSNILSTDAMSIFRFAIIDFDKKLLMATNGTAFAVKPVFWEEKDDDTIKGKRLISKEMLEICHERSVIIKKQGFEIDGLGKFAWVPIPTLTDGTPMVIPDLFEFGTKMNSEKPYCKIRFSRKNLIDLLRSLPYDDVTLNMFMEPKKDKGTSLLNLKSLVHIQGPYDKNPLALFSTKDCDDIEYFIVQDGNEFFQPNYQTRIDTEAEKHD